MGSFRLFIHSLPSFLPPLPNVAGCPALEQESQLRITSKQVRAKSTLVIFLQDSSWSRCLGKYQEEDGVEEVSLVTGSQIWQLADEGCAETRAGTRTFIATEDQDCSSKQVGTFLSRQ